MVEEFSKDGRVALSQQSFYNFIAGKQCTRNQDVINYVCGVLGKTIEEVMVNYVAIGMTRSEWDKAKVETPEKIRKKMADDQTRAEKVMESNPERVASTFKDIDGAW